MTKEESAALELARSRMESGVGQDDDNVAELLVLIDRLAKVEEKASVFLCSVDLCRNGKGPTSMALDAERDLRVALTPPPEAGSKP